jgi:hypothetical protein
VQVDGQPPSVAPGARYRLRVEPTVKGAVRIVAVVERLAKPPGAAVSYDVCDDCLSHRVEWGQAARRGPTTVFAVEPCRGFAVRAVGHAVPGGCTAHLACSPELAGKIESVLGYSDVKAALARAPVVFGRDVRAVDGTFLRIAVDGKELFVGPDCDGEPNCWPAPAGVSQLASELTHAHVVTDDDGCGVR